MWEEDLRRRGENIIPTKEGKATHTAFPKKASCSKNILNIHLSPKKKPTTQSKPLSFLLLLFIMMMLFFFSSIRERKRRERGVNSTGQRAFFVVVDVALRPLFPLKKTSSPCFIQLLSQGLLSLPVAENAWSWGKKKSKACFIPWEERKREEEEGDGKKVHLVLVLYGEVHVLSKEKKGLLLSKPSLMRLINNKLVVVQAKQRVAARKKKGAFTCPREELRKFAAHTD